MGQRFGGRQQAPSEPKLPPPSPRPGREQSPARSAHSHCSPPPSPSHAEKPLGSLFSESKSKLGFKLRASYRGERCTKMEKGEQQEESKLEPPTGGRGVWGGSSTHGGRSGERQRLPRVPGGSAPTHRIPRAGVAAGAPGNGWLWVSPKVSAWSPAARGKSKQIAEHQRDRAPPGPLALRPRNPAQGSS